MTSGSDVASFQQYIHGAPSNTYTTYSIVDRGMRNHDPKTVPHAWRRVKKRKKYSKLFAGQDGSIAPQMELFKLKAYLLGKEMFDMHLRFDTLQIFRGFRATSGNFEEA